MPDPIYSPDQPKQKRLYSAPRRFDLATMLVVTTAYGILFAGMKLLNFPKGGFFLVAGLITVVGVAQSLFHNWRNPRAVSVLAGMTCYAVIAVWDRIETGFYVQIGTAVIGAVLSGGMLGYFFGVGVAGVFLLADYLRCGLLGRAPQTKTDVEQASLESPWDDIAEP